jgi:quercetin dioxygenase-like cupin family protein
VPEDEETGMTADKGFMLGPGEGLGGTRTFLRRPMRMLADGAATGDAFTLFEQEEKQGFVMPLHIHRTENEAFYVLDGRLLVACGEDRWEADAGSFVFLPRGVPHAFTVVSKTVRMLQLTIPSGFEGFAAELADVPLWEENFPMLVEAAGRHGISILGPAPFKWTESSLLRGE